MNPARSSTRWWDWFAISFVLVIMLTSATRLYSTHWTVFLERVQYLSLLGIILGFALGQSRFSPAVVRLMAIGYTLFAIPWQLGSTVDTNLEWGDRLQILATRIGVAGSDFLSKRAVHDPILFLTLMAILFWIIAVIAGYALTRHGQPWPTILPAGIAMIVISHYDPGAASTGRYLGVFLFFSLLLLGRMTYLRYRTEWQFSGVMQSPGTGLDMGRAALMAVVVLVLFAWTVPAIGASLSPASQLWVRISQPWEKLRGRFSDAFSSLQSSVGVVTDFYGRTMSLGTGTRLGNDIVFTVQASEPPPAGARYYWRARSYDYYDGQWSSTITTEEPINPKDFTVTYPKWEGREQVTFAFNSHVTLLNTLYTPPLPLVISHPGKATMLANPDGSDDVALISADPPLRAGERYEVTGWVSVPTVSQLLATDTNYPEWIKTRYLELPGSLSPKFKDLAQRVTNGLSTPYDKTQAITEYLRRTITYKESIPEPPQGTDPLEWFLFDVKQGYCNYYATAEVVLLRSLGIPARLSVGFAQGEQVMEQITGERREPTGTFIVRYKESHAWPEVYFNGVGWVEFEPTVSQPSRDLPLGSAIAEPPLSAIDPFLGEGRFGPRTGIDDPINTLAIQNAARRTMTTRLILGSSLLAAVAAAGLFWRHNRGRFQLPVVPVWLESSLNKRGVSSPSWLRRWARWAVFSPLQRAYGVVNQALRLVGRPGRPSETPAERAAVLGSLLPLAKEPAETIVREYQQAQYSPYPGDIPRAKTASRIVRMQAWKAFFSRLIHRGR